MHARSLTAAALIALGALLPACGGDRAGSEGGAGKAGAGPDVAPLDGQADETGEHADPGTDRFVLAFGGKAHDQANAVAVAQGGGLFVAGRSPSAGQGDDDALLIRLSGCGEVKWARLYGGKAKDTATGVAATDDGGAVITGMTASFGQAEQAWLVKVDAEGKVQWARAYGGHGYDAGRAVVAVDGGYAAIAETYNFGPATPEHHNLLVYQVDDKGGVTREKTLGGGVDGDAGFAIAELTGPDGGTAGLLLGGATESYSMGHDDVWLIELGKTGKLLWSRSYGGVEDDELRAMSLLPDGGVVATGFSRGYTAQKSDAFAMRTDAAGKLLWFRLYGGAERETGYAIVPRGEGFLLVGRTASWGFSAGDSGDGFVAGLAHTGEALWWRQLGGKSGDALFAAVPYGDGVVAVGRSASFSVGRDFDALIMRADADGDTGCGLSDLPLEQLGVGVAQPTVGSELPMEATGMTAQDVQPVTTPVPDPFAWAAHACAAGACER